LSNNRLTGYIPNFTHLDVGNLDVSRDEIDGIDAKFNLPVMNIKLNYNKISKIPIFISVPDAIFIHDTLILNNNNLTFEYLLPNLSMIKRMGSRAPYAPQDSIFRDTSIFLFVGDSLSIDLKIDSQINTNRYQWFKDGQPYGQVNNSNKLVIRNFQPRDEGTYRVQVTNPALPALTLHSKAIRLKADLSNSAFEFFPSFTPNGDGINETFVIRAKKLNLCPSGKLIECYPNNELLIYNRNGELIARKQGYQNDWNAAGQPAGNYHYIFYRDRIDRKKADRGIITILK
jgi:gliding motility-associated-like protein